MHPAFFCGIAGALFAINFEILTEENLNLATSGSILLITFLGGVGFFVGPVIGAVVFTLLQTVLSLYTEIWQLYLGILFVLTVMFFPTGLTGLIAMHFRPWNLGKAGLLIRPYAVMALPALVFVMSAVALMEILFHARHASIGDEEMSLFGITFNSHSPAPLIVTCGLLVASFLVVRKLAPALREAWDEANFQRREG